MPAKTLEFLADGALGADGTLRVRIRVGDTEHTVQYKSADVRLTPSIDGLLTLTLLPAMSQGAAVQVRGEASPRLLAAVPRIMDVVCGWNPDLQRVAIDAAVPRATVPTGGHRVASFFSGGLDSFYTLLKHRDSITDLIHIHGFQRQPRDVSLRRRTSELVHRVAAQFGKNVIEIESDYRAFLAPYVSHTLLAHGASLATVGHLLGPDFKRIYIAASYHRSDLFPWGSHPDLDPLWSTESLEVVHEGCDATRVEKARLVARSDLALQSLRVCHKNSPENLNCGRCEKCVRTMINLVAVGALDRCPTFAAPLTVRKVRGLLGGSHGPDLFMRENLQALDESGCNPALAEAMRTVLNRPRWRTHTIAAMREFGTKLGRIYPLNRVVRRLERRA
jgi:hypothetical protein